MDLADRAAVITGGSRGLGRAIAARFVEEGASVLLVARDPGPLEQARAELAAHTVRPGQSVHALAADVARPDTADAVAALAGKELPDLAVLVNNAGVYGPFGAVDEVPWEAWEHAVRVNLFGPVLLSRALVPALRRRGFGKIVNVSGGGATSPLPRISAYAAAKAALVRLTETFACELRADHIDVNALAPGPLDTRLLDELLAAGPEGVGPRDVCPGAAPARGGRHAAREGRGAGAVPGLGAQRRDHRPLAERYLGRLGVASRPA